MWHLVNCKTQMKFYDLGSPAGDAGLNCKFERGQDLEKLILNASKNEKKDSQFFIKRVLFQGFQQGYCKKRK